MCRRVEADWKQVERDFGLIEGMEGVPNALKIASATYEPSATVISFCNPALLKETVDKLANKDYVKLCGDGTFRLTNGDWVFLTVGALTKHYSEGDGIKAFRTKFNPLMFALTNKESQPTYQHFFDALVNCTSKLTGVDLTQVCQQYHADLHPGEDLAQKAVFQHADRVADWAHRSKHRKQDHPVSERIAAYRAGVFATMKKHLSPAGQALVPLIERALHCMRSLPTALLFHTVADLLLRTLVAQQPSEKKAADMLKQHYLAKVPAARAQAEFSINEWPGDASFLFAADWWAGRQRLQPASASGTQAQESWHKNKLKNDFKNLDSSLPSFASLLEQFSQSRLSDSERPGETLPVFFLQFLFGKVFVHRIGNTCQSVCSVIFVVVAVTSGLWFKVFFPGCCLLGVLPCVKTCFHRCGFSEIRSC